MKEEKRLIMEGEEGEWPCWRGIKFIGFMLLMVIVVLSILKYFEVGRFAPLNAKEYNHNCCKLNNEKKEDK
jgi:hypothetical protein